MENLLRRAIKQNVPTHAVVFIIINIVSFFSVIFAASILILKAYLISNVIRVDVFAVGIFAALGNIVLIVTGIVSIFDYKRVILHCLEDIKTVEEYCDNIIQEVENEQINI